jgi:hypothetical protein
LPVDFHKGKSIDDLLVRGNELILVDDIMFPKYIFTYDITEPSNPKHLATEKLPNNGTYEHIKKSDAGGDTVVLLSSTAGECGAGQFISTLKDGKRSFTLSSGMGDWNEEKQYDPPIIDICLAGNMLYILQAKNRAARLSVLDMDGAIIKEAVKPIPLGLAEAERLIKHRRALCLR